MLPYAFCVKYYQFFNETLDTSFSYFRAKLESVTAYVDHYLVVCAGLKVRLVSSVLVKMGSYSKCSEMQQCWKIHYEVHLVSGFSVKNGFCS